MAHLRIVWWMKENLVYTELYEVLSISITIKESNEQEDIVFALMFSFHNILKEPFALLSDKAGGFFA